MVSRSLGTSAAAAGRLVLILDMDTQQNSTSGRRRRPAELPMPHVQFATENDLAETLARAEAAGCDLVLSKSTPLGGRRNRLFGALLNRTTSRLHLWRCMNIRCIGTAASKARQPRKFSRRVRLPPTYITAFRSASNLSERVASVQ